MTLCPGTVGIETGMNRPSPFGLEPTLKHTFYTHIHSFLLHSASHSPTHQDDLDVSRRSTVTRRVQIDVQSYSHFRQVNVVDHRLTSRRIDRRVVSVINIALWIVHTQTIALNVALRSERERLNIGSDF